MKSNLEHWKKMQEKDYFEKHSCYNAQDGELKIFGDDVDLINRHLKLTPEMKVVVIGCGYGRESALIAPHVAHVYGIDVSELILQKTRKFLGRHGVNNFTPVLAERWEMEIPSGIDLVFSHAVFQHLTRDLVKDYVGGLAAKLSPQGKFLLQFIEDTGGTHDAELKVYEPSVSWNAAEIGELIAECSLVKYDVEERVVSDKAKCFWACFGKAKPA